MEKTRLNKYLSEIGFCSRRKADQLIQAGKILVNGKLPELGLKVDQSDQIIVDGEEIQKTEKPAVYIVYNKPAGITCTTDLRVEGNIIEAINYSTRIFPIGRLDKPSEGLILLTDDGDIVNKILRARNFHEKEYIVTVDKPITQKFLHRMRAGVPILDTVTRPCQVYKLEDKKFKIILTQGLNRQIRRMCHYLSYNVQTLKRVRIMNIKLDIPAGVWRPLRPKELKNLNKLLKDSKKEHE